jgi:hypothetical protein
MGKYDHLYRPSPEFIRYHEDDKDLSAVNIIDVPLPKQPEYKEMINYGLHPSKQFFVRPEMPAKLAELNRRRTKDVEDYWTEIRQHKDYYKDDFWFIEQDIKRREDGIWILINGYATFIPKWHYFFLTSYTVGPTKGKFFDYRDRDRRWFLFAEYCDESPVCWGFNFPKHRREGATSRVASIILNLATAPSVKQLLDNALKHGIQSKDEPSAANVFLKHIVPQYKNLPFWQIPRNSNTSSPKAELNFGPLSTKKSKDDSGVLEGEYLNTIVDYKASGELLYDGEKLRIHMGDEIGKTKEANVEKRTSTVRLCCSEGNEIIGLIINPSTVGEMDREGGANFKELCQNSMFSDKDENDQTLSGLYNLFMPAYDGLQGFIGPFGESIIDDPTPEQAEYMRIKSPKIYAHMESLYKMKNGTLEGFKPIGAKQYLINRRAALLSKGKTEALAKEKRQHPMAWKECWTMQVDDSCPFDLWILENRLEEFAIGKNPFVKHGNFEYENWDNNKWMPQDLPTLEDFISGRTRVIFVETDEENADWEVSYLFDDPKLSNRFIFNHTYQTYEPANKNKFAAGGDPIKNKVKIKAVQKNKKSSFAAGTIFRKFDSSVDDPNHQFPNETNPKTGDTNWVTDRFCAVYHKKPKLKAMYGEAMLKACLYYGCAMFPEPNLPYLTEYFDETRGFAEWLQYKIDYKTKREKHGEFVHNNDRVQIEIYGEWADHIKRNGMREVHPILLEQARDVGPDGMTDNDAFAAGGYTLLSVKQSRLFKLDEKPVEKQTLNANDVFDHFDTMAG